MAKNHTGGKVPESGIWKPKGGGKEIAVSKDDTFPPSQKKGTDYTLVRKTK